MPSMHMQTDPLSPVYPSILINTGQICPSLQMHISNIVLIDFNDNIEIINKNDNTKEYS